MDVGKKCQYYLILVIHFFPSTNIEQQTNARNWSRYENQRCLGRSPCLCEIYILLGGQFGKGNSNPLQYSCLENPVDRGAWWAAVHGVAQSRTRLKRLSMHASLEKEVATHSRVLA